jgi:hypothetical protein
MWHEATTFDTKNMRYMVDNRLPIVIDTPVKAKKSMVYKILKWVAILAVYGISVVVARNVGRAEGVDIYHEVCYNVGGVVQNNNTYVYCQPVPLDNKEVMLYNQ